jgi:tetratricopeptide (TPR) repeat protein
VATEAAPAEALKAPRKKPRGRGVFISYRRADASGFAGRLHDSLTARFGPDRVFRDIDSIEPGTDFAERIDSSLTECGAFVVVIGKEWVVDSAGRRRLDDPDDWVRRELEAALGRTDVLVVPALVEDAHMPAAADLPESLWPLVALQGLSISDSRWDYDVKRLTDVIDLATSTRGSRLVRRLKPRSTLGAAARVLVTAAAVVALVWGLLPLLRPSTDTSPGRMTGDYNIAVATFDAIDANGNPVESSDAEDLATSVYDLLHTELEPIAQAGFDLDLRPPAETGTIRGSTPERRAEAAAKEAERIRADVIVYGTLQQDVPNRFTAEFFLGDRQLHDAEELFGQHELGSVIDTPGDIRNTVIRKGLRDQILGRTRALAEFVVGLSHYGAHQYQPALEHFQAAVQTASWDDRDGKEVLYLFLGNASGRLDDLDKAAAAYDQALALNPEYARARLGRAEVLLHKARGTCEAGHVDAAGLAAALDAFHGAETAKVQPALSDIPTKVAFGEGRVHLCQSQALVGDHWADAEREFQQVVAEFLNGNRRVTELAGEAYANLGFVHLPAAGAPDAASRYRQAAADYQSAFDISTDDDRKAFFSGMRGFVLGRVGETAQADAAYRLAAQLARDPAVRDGYERSRQALNQPPA